MHIGERVAGDRWQWCVWVAQVLAAWKVVVGDHCFQQLQPPSTSYSHYCRH